MSPSTSSFRRRSRSASYGPMISELRQVASVSVPETTYFVVSLKNGAPGSSSTVRVDHAGSNISYVVRPSRMPRELAVAAPMVSPMRGSKPYSNVHVGAPITPSRLMNSCTTIAPIAHLRVEVCARIDLAACTNSSLAAEARLGIDHALDGRALVACHAVVATGPLGAQDRDRRDGRVAARVEAHAPDQAVLVARSPQLAGHGGACAVRARDRVEHQVRRLRRVDRGLVH